MKTTDRFEYHYSAKEQEEIRQIRRKYEKPEFVPESREDKLNQLRKLDQKSNKKGLVLSILCGVAGMLCFGAGLSCILVWTDTLFAAGVTAGILGIVLIMSAYPLHKKITERERRKIAPQIVQLTDELMQ